MMKPFLWLVAETFYNKYQEDIQHIAFIFPNRRAGIFFKKYLAEIAQKPFISPTILTVTDLFSQLSDLQTADKIELLFTIYKIYIELTNREESFDEFISLGETLINDFDDTDKYMADARQLYANIHDLKEIDARFGSPLTEEQVAYIRRFWKNFIPTEGKINAESNGKQKFSNLWGILYELYEKLKTELRSQGIGYEGMIFRDVAEKITNKNNISLPYQKIVFVGLNVLTEAEKALMKELRNRGIGDFYWDNSAPTLHDEYNKASHFLQGYIKEFPSSLTLIDERQNYEYPEINVIGVPSAVGQAKESERILNHLLNNGYISSPDEAINTAIILPDEHLLMPVLYAIPEKINSINITMGYTLSNTTIAGFMEILADMHKHTRRTGDNILYYHRNVLALLTNRYMQLTDQKIINNACDDIRKHNKIYIPAKELWLNELLQHIFTPINTAYDACDYLLQILIILQDKLSKIATNNNDNENNTVSTIALEQEYIYHYYLIVNRLKDLINTHLIDIKVATFFKLLKKLSSNISIPFEGEPLSGLQIMGVLETRALDFENVIILSMNEGVFPVKKVANSIIPYNLRKGFNLSTTEHQDSIYAYYFYRLIYRARRLFLLYDTRTEEMATGEMSRYIYQLKYHYRVNMQHRIAGYQITTKENSSISVSKDKYIMERLSHFLDGGNRYLSASAINSYINCPLQFFLCYIEQLQEIEDVTENIDAGIFGSIYHNVMQQIYDRLEGKVIQAEALNNIEKDDKLLTDYLEKAFAKEYFKLNLEHKKAYPLTGQNYLIGEVIRKYVKRTLQIDRAQTPFTYIKSERKITHSYNYGGEKSVQLKGFIDRMDMHNDIIRIVDYKTGKDKLECRSIEELFDKEGKERPKAIMQVLMYALMIKENDQPNQKLAPAIYKIQELFSNKNFNPTVLMNLVPLYYTDEIDKEFRIEFNRCLQEIFDPQRPFTQTEKTDENGPCKYCPVGSICRQMAE